jgi:hypothetical protein
VAGAPEWDDRPQEPAPHGDIVGPGRVFVYDLATLDTDGDTLPDDWETTFGLDPADPTDAAMDPDSDGLSNAQEHAAHSHPRGAPTDTRYFAEAATSEFFETEFAIANPGNQVATVNLRFMTAAGELVSTALPVPARQSRRVRASQLDAISRAEFSTTIESDQAVAVDRLVWWDRATRYGSHGERALASPAATWFLAEGATGDFFDLFVLIANPGATDARIEATYLLQDGTTLVKPHTVPARSRFNIWVDHEDAQLADTAVSTTVRSTNSVPVIVERAMWWPGSCGQWYEAHNSPGATTTGTTWAVADGEVGGAHNSDTYVLIANVSAYEGRATVTLLFEDGATTEKAFTLLPDSRFNVDVRHEFPGSVGRRFGASVTSDAVPYIPGPSPLPIYRRAELVVEWAIYSDALGQRWAAGANALATRLP